MISRLKKQKRERQRNKEQKKTEREKYRREYIETERQIKGKEPNRWINGGPNDTSTIRRRITILLLLSTLSTLLYPILSYPILSSYLSIHSSHSNSQFNSIIPSHSIHSYNTFIHSFIDVSKCYSRGYLQIRKHTFQQTSFHSLFGRQFPRIQGQHTL